MAWDEEQLQEDIADEFASFDHFVEEDMERGRQIITQVRAKKRQVRRALNRIAGAPAHEKRKEHNRQAARRRSAAKTKAVKPAPVGRPRKPRPSKTRVLNLRAQKMSWPAIAKRLKCSEWVARTVAGAVNIKRVPSKS